MNLPLPLLGASVAISRFREELSEAILRYEPLTLESPPGFPLQKIHLCLGHLAFSRPVALWGAADSFAASVGIASERDEKLGPRIMPVISGAHWLSKDDQAKLVAWASRGFDRPRQMIFLCDGGLESCFPLDVPALEQLMLMRRLRIPSMKERREDVGEMAQAALREIDPKLELAADTRNYLLEHDWGDGDVTDLIATMVLSAGRMRSDRIQLSPKDVYFVEPKQPLPEGGSSIDMESALDATRRRVIVEALSRAEGNASEAARLLGKERTYVAKLARKLGVPFHRKENKRRRSKES